MMTSASLLVSVGLVVGALVVLIYIAAYCLSPTLRKKIEQPKHAMLDSINRLWSPRDTEKK